MKFQLLRSDSELTLYIAFTIYPSNVPVLLFDISSVLYEQPYNIGVTISCSPTEWSVLQNIEKKSNEKV